MENEVRVNSFETQMGRTVVARIRRDTDLVTGLIEVCRSNNIKTGVLEMAIGSLRSARFCWAVPADNKRGARRSDLIDVDGPIEFIAGQGIICVDGEKPMYHIHGVLTDKDGKSWSGHFFEGGNPIHVTMDVIIREVQGVGIKGIYDEDVDVVVNVPYPIGENDK